MKLTIYEKKKAVKTYEADTYDLMWNTVEDVAAAVDIDSLKDATNVEIIKFVAKFVVTDLDVFKNLMKDIFEGLTDEELRNTRVKDIAAVVVDVVKFTMGEFATIGTSKN